jgi:hypothetical protein
LVPLELLQAANGTTAIATNRATAWRFMRAR